MNGENLHEQLADAIAQRDAARALLPTEAEVAHAIAALTEYADFGAECEEREYTDTGTAWEVPMDMAAALQAMTARALGEEAAGDE